MLYQQAKTYQTRPSQLLGIRDAWLAFQVDQAVWYAGAFVEAKQGERVAVKKKPKKTDEIVTYEPRWTLDEILDGKAGDEPQQQGQSMAGFMAAFGGSIEVMP